MTLPFALLLVAGVFGFLVVGAWLLERRDPLDSLRPLSNGRKPR